MDNIGYDTVVRLGGGGGAGFIYLALIRILEEMGKDPNEIFWSGDSIGASFSTALSTGMTYEEAGKKLDENSGLIDRVMIPTTQEIIDARRYKREGFGNPEKLELIAEKLFGEITVGELPNLDIIVTDVTDAEDIHDYMQRKPVEINYKTFPKLPVKKAIAASETLVPAFYPYRLNYNGKDILCMDGGQSYRNLVNLIVPPGYSGRVISIDPMHKFNSSKFAAFLQKTGIMEGDGHKPEAFRKGLKVTEFFPKILRKSFISTSPKNIKNLDKLGYQELEGVREYL